MHSNFGKSEAMPHDENRNDTYSLLYSEMDTALLNAELQRRPNEGFSVLIRLVRQYIIQLKAVTGQPFLDEDEEIKFFRDTWPKFYSKLFYYQLVNAFESDREGKPPETQARLTHEVQQVIADFFDENKEFWTYYRDSSEVINPQFTRKFSNSCLYDPLSVLLDREWATIAGYRAARALAYVDLGTYLERVKQSLSNAGARHWEWHESKTAAAELIIGLAGTSSIFINGKPATAAQLKTDFEERYHLDLSDFNKLLYASDLRKKDETPYLTKLRIKFLERKERLGK